MKSTNFALASLVASAAVAQPHRQPQHQHQAKHVKKDVVWVTDWVSVTETVGYTTTIWVDEGFVPSTAAASQPSSSPKAASVAPSSSTAVPAQFFEPASKQSSSSVYVAPTPSSTYGAPVQSVQAVSVPEVKSSASTASVYVPPTTTAPAYTAPTSTAAAAPSSSAAAGTGSGSTGGASSTGTTYNGDFTYYDAGLGACGLTNDGTTDKVVALSKLLMGTQSNSGDGANANPYCGKTITVKYNGKTTTAKVVDKCGDCTINSIDLSKAAFADLADESLGRGQAEWWFN
jgi:hypothetical protein